MDARCAEPTCAAPLPADHWSHWCAERCYRRHWKRYRRAGKPWPPEGLVPRKGRPPGRRGGAPPFARPAVVLATARHAGIVQAEVVEHPKFGRSVWSRTPWHGEHPVRLADDLDVVYLAAELGLVAA